MQPCSTAKCEDNGCEMSGKYIPKELSQSTTNVPKSERYGVETNAICGPKLAALCRNEKGNISGTRYCKVEKYLQKSRVSAWNWARYASTTNGGKGVESRENEELGKYVHPILRYPQIHPTDPLSTKNAYNSGTRTAAVTKKEPLERPRRGESESRFAKG
ncbi:hypothetical protein EDC04DRAFT_3087812 [Pisolithus marmoratus]|nr:hypothetical protein EDC04DRAFT_3087812 [Pisolithus marmoratus]